ncbi:methyltransferase domain-containing protein [Seiridium cupressi]
MSQYPPPEGEWPTYAPVISPSDVAIESEDGDVASERPPQGRQHSNSVPDSTQATWYPRVPLPSELLESYQPPAHLSFENVPVAGPASLGQGHAQYSEISTAMAAERDPNFAARANDLINEILGRESSGTSVIEPDSVLGESGRLYSGYHEGKYFLPNDAAEQDRLDLQHEIYRLLFDGWLALAPMSSPPRYVLDVGTGTGLWAKEFAEQNPSSYVIGSDLSAIQPATSLSNLAFTKDDAEDPWIFPVPASNARPSYEGYQQQTAQFISFDYVHLRLMFTCFNDTRAVIKHAFDNLAPLGWLEFQDMGPEIEQANPDFTGDALKRWGESCARGALNLGRDLTVTRKYKKWLEEAGFVEVRETRFVLPVHQWMEDPKFKEIGRFNQRNMMDGVRGGGWMMLKAAGMTPNEIEDLTSQVRKELQTESNHSYCYVYVVYGQKPLAGEGASSLPTGPFSRNT